jgi:hypothetical protein
LAENFPVEVTKACSLRRENLFKKEKLMNIGDYDGYFHDGSLMAFKQYDKTIEVWMASSEITPEWGVDASLLSGAGRLCGKLILTGVKNITSDERSIEKLPVFISPDIDEWEGSPHCPPLSPDCPGKSLSKESLVEVNEAEKAIQEYEDGEILDLDVYKDSVRLLIIWSTYPPKGRQEKFEEICIQADRIEWKNIPNLFDSSDL